MPFRDISLEQCLAHAATDDQWAAYQRVADAAPPQLFSYPDPMRGASDSYRERDLIEREIWQNALPQLISGQWRAVGRWIDQPNLTPIEPRLWRTITCNFLSFRENRVWLVVGEQYFSDVFVSEVASEAQVSQSEKEQLRRRLKKWFASHREANAVPQSKPAWLEMAKDEFPALTPNLFNGVWEALGHPHSLKLEGRPRE